MALSPRDRRSNPALGNYQPPQSADLATGQSRCEILNMGYSRVFTISEHSPRKLCDFMSFWHFLQSKHVERERLLTGLGLQTG